MKRIYRHTSQLALGLCMIMTAVSGYSQTGNDYLRAAETFYSKGDYYSAARYYERFLSGKADTTGAGFTPYVATRATSEKQKVPTGATRHQVVYKTAESYRLLNNWIKAEPYYQEAVSFGDQYPMARYWYAMSLK